MNKSLEESPRANSFPCNLLTVGTFIQILMDGVEKLLNALRTLSFFCKLLSVAFPVFAITCEIYF